MPKQIGLINEGIGCHTLTFTKIFEGIIDVQRVCFNLEFLPITGGMKAIMIFTVDIGQLHPIHEPDDTVIGRPDIIERKTPVYRVLQSTIINQF